MTQAPRVVFDCTVFAQAFINPSGPAGACIAAAQAGRARLFVSTYVLREVFELSTKLSPRFGITRTRILNFLTDAAKYTELARDIPEVFEYPRDPDDAHYVNLAAAVGAEFLVSRDNDLLELVDDQPFRSRFASLRIVPPPVFLNALRSPG